MSSLDYVEEDTGVPGAAWTRQISMEDRWVKWGDSYCTAHALMLTDGWVFEDCCNEGPESSAELHAQCLAVFGSEGEAKWEHVNSKWLPLDPFGPDRGAWFHAHLMLALDADEPFGYWFGAWVIRNLEVVLFGDATEKLVMGLACRALLRLHQHCVAKCVQNLLALDSRGPPSEV